MSGPTFLIYLILCFSVASILVDGGGVDCLAGAVLLQRREAGATVVTAKHTRRETMSDINDGTYLIKVESRIFLVKEAESEAEARRTAYEAFFGEPTNDEEVATDETIRQYTMIYPLPIVISR